MKPGVLIAALVLAVEPAMVMADDKVFPEAFAGADNALNREELIEYLLCRKDVTYATLMGYGGMTAAAKEAATANWLADIEDHIKHSPPYTPAEVRKAEQLPEYVESSGDEKPEPMDGIFENSRELGENGEIGPFRIRSAVEDWSKKLGDVTGATISYQENQLSDSTTWSAKGAIIYPIVFSDGTDRPEGAAFSSFVSAFTPAVNWNIVDVDGTDEGDVQELQFNLPFSLQGNHSAIELRSELSLAPYYATDLSFDSSIVGASLVYEPIFQIGKHFDVGQFHSLGGKKKGPAYLIRLLPKLDYSNVLETSRFVSRPEGDEWFRAGGKVEVALRPFGKNARWELRGSYGAMWDLEGGDDDFSDLIEAKALFWLSESAGLSFSYQKGQTPVADKDIEMLSLGFELKL